MSDTVAQSVDNCPPSYQVDIVMGEMSSYRVDSAGIVPYDGGNVTNFVMDH